MAFSASFHPNLGTGTSHHHSKLLLLRHNRRQQKSFVWGPSKRKVHFTRTIKVVLDKKTSSINDSGATGPARVLLERLFAQTQKLEEQMSRDSRFHHDVQLGLNLEILESDLQAALEALKKKEEDLQDAEQRVLLEYAILDRAKEELEQREQEIASASSKKEELEDELKKTNLNLAYQAREVEDLKLRNKERDREVSAARSTLSLKEDEINNMRNELAKKSEEAAKAGSELKCKAQLLSDATEVVKKQDIEINHLRKVIQEKEEELELSATVRRINEEKLKVAEANLVKQTTDWLVAQKEMKKLADEVSRHVGENSEAMEDFRRVKKLLADVRSELVSSQKALALSRQKMGDQELLLERQLFELEEQKTTVMSYMNSLRNAHMEVESERMKLKIAETRNKELEQDLLIEKEITEDLQEELNKERSSLQKSIQEVAFLKEELHRKSTEFEETHKLLDTMESELVDSKLQIQHLKSERASLEIMLEEKDSELLIARNKLEELNREVGELKLFLNGREEQLIQATAMLKEKEEHVEMITHELNDTKLKSFEAEDVVGRIVKLTNKLVFSVKNEDYLDLGLTELLTKPSDENVEWHNQQLEIELELTKESLRMKEMEVLAANRALSVKNEELKSVLERLDAKEKELTRMKEEMVDDADDLKKLYGLVQKRIGDKSIGDLANEKLQLEAAQLEVEAATSALHKLAEMSRELLNKSSLSIEVDFGTDIFAEKGSDPRLSTVDNNECFAEVKTEVAQLSALTERLLKEAGIVVMD